MKINVRLTLQYGLTIFLSAFLLFQVQPLIGKMILPWFGGSAAVWTTCMLFFQMVLLLGYMYSHWVVRYLRPSKQSLVHGGLLLLSLALIPISPSLDWKPLGDENPTLRILGLLTVSIGLPYFVLSTTGPLLQAWFARERSGLVPYRLFALSNFGSMLALLAYPVVVEPVLPIAWQSYTWSGLYACFVLACCLLAWRGRHGQALSIPVHAVAQAPTWRDRLLWVALAACPSILMVADTSFLTTNIAPMPMIWVAPLALYLLSFILSFERAGWYRRVVFLPLFVVSLCALAYLPTMGIDELPIALSMGINLSAFFVVCMVCHGELARQQPHPAYLTAYFLMLAVGGVLGGFFVGVLAPYWFNNNYELSIAMVLSGIVAALAVLPSATFPTPGRRRLVIAASLLFLLGLSWLRIDDHLQETDGAEVTVRNFYGTLQVYENTSRERRSMLHGQIVHGQQSTNPAKLDWATTYYSPQGGAGRVMQIKAAAPNPMRVGVVGLGIGTLATYARTGDVFRFYEIDPLVIKLAKENFSYLARSKARIDMVLGDARLKLEREPNQNYDVLVIDAFSGDSVPIHLLTFEAFEQYARHLKPDGVLAVHITNRFLDLRPVLASAAQHLTMDMRLVDGANDGAKLINHSRWALLSRQPAFFEHTELSDASRFQADVKFRPWKDDYSSILSVLY